MKHKKLNSLRQNILYKKSPMNNGKNEKNVLSNLYSNSIPIKFHDSSNKNDELLMKNKIFNYNKNLNHLNLGSFFHNNHNSFKTLNKNHSNIKNNNIINNSKEQSINKSKKNYNISKSIDSSINNNSKDLYTLNKNNNNIPLYNLFNKTLFNNNKNKTAHISLNKIKTTRDNIAFFSKSGNKFTHKNMPGLNFDKISKNKKLSVTNINSRENTPKKKNILLKKNIQNINKIIRNEKNESQNYRKYLFNEKINNINLSKKGFEQFDEARKEIIQIINENKMKNKGLFYLYNHQTNLANQKKNLKCTTKYPSFNSPKNIAINNSNIYNISKGDISYKKPFMIFAPSSNNSINKKQKEDKSKEYLYSCKNENNNDICNILSDMPSNQNEENNDKRMSSRKNKKSINRLQIFSKNDSNKNLNNNNNNNINLDKNISKINNINNKINNLEKKLKLNKKISNNLVVNKDKEIKNDNIIEKYNSFSNSNKEIREKKLNSIGSEQNNNELIPKRQKSVGSNNDTTKKESKNESNKNLFLYQDIYYF